jgi:imidazolonepropionase-like amidohydrolase
LAAERNRRLQEFRELFRVARAYLDARASATQRRQQGPVLDPRLDALAPYVSGQRPVVIRADSDREILQAIDLADDVKFRLIISGARDAWKVVDRIKEKDVALIVGPVATLCGADYDPYHAPFTNLAKLHAKGIRFCIQSDDASNARNLPFEAALAVAYGLAPEAGLRAITLSPAEILGVEQELGSLTRGKTANLVIADGDPLQASTRIHGVFIAGRPYPPTSRHTALYEKWRARLPRSTSSPRPAPMAPTATESH